MRGMAHIDCAITQNRAISIYFVLQAREPQLESVITGVQF
jgi:hypothetical protein